MKVTKEFAPVTVVFETKEELNDFLSILSAASTFYQDSRVCDGKHCRSMLEKCYLLGKDLKK